MSTAQERMIKTIKKAQEKEKKRLVSEKNCISCGIRATHCMRGLPQNTYCKECALSYFKFLNYLEKM